MWELSDQAGLWQYLSRLSKGRSPCVTEDTHSQSSDEIIFSIVYLFLMKFKFANFDQTRNFLGSIENPVEMSAPRTSPDKPESPSWSSSPARKKKTKEAQVTYLNVHAGVSVGVMAGMDVGAQDRFEVSILDSFLMFAFAIVLQ